MEWGGCSLGVRGGLEKETFNVSLFSLSLWFFLFRGHYDEKEDCGLYVRGNVYVNASFMLLKDV